MTVRTRIAPSPTGAPHIGTAYIALFNYAFAKKHGGEFILRIEDTDQTRCTPESEREIFEALRWAGLSWSEGPDVGGPHGPYRQSERTEIYREHAEMLVTKDAAYPCFCTVERLNELRKQQTEAKQMLGYDGHCAAIPPEEAQRRIAAGEPHVIRMRVPSEGDCVVHDRLRGEIRIPWGQVDHQVLVKTDGFPTYHLANVVDDHLMGITHVIRGEEWISSTPKHVRLYELFGWEAPEFVHLPLLRNPDKSKLSKRKNPTSILYYRRAGIMPEALLNYLGQLAYSMSDGREVFTLDDLCAAFDLDRVSLGGPIFDLVKLKNFNGRYIRELSSEALLEKMKGWLLNDETWLKVIPLAQQRLETYSDLLPKAAFLFADQLNYPASALTECGIEPAKLPELLRTVQWEMEKPGAWTKDRVHHLLNAVAEKEDIKTKTLFGLFFITMTGEKVSLPLFDSIELMGRDLTLRRIQYAIETLEQSGIALSGKRLKAFEKEYAERYGKAG